MNGEITEMSEYKTENNIGNDEKIIVKLGKPFNFEGKEYEEIDLSGLGKLTVQAAIDAQKRLFAEREVAGAMLSETTTAFARNLAAQASEMPIEFFKLLPRGAMKKVSAAVRGYLNVEAKTENHVMTLEAPQYYKGKQYTQIDLGGIANLSGMHESEAENRLVREGFMVTETTFNYLYACVVASQATGIDEEFFTGLPIKETLKLKNAVNDGDFFK